MSVTVANNQIQVQDGSTVVFDSGRRTPHILQSVSGTINISNPTIWNSDAYATAELLNQGISALTYHLYGGGENTTFYNTTVNPDRAFTLSYFKINSLPTTGRFGQFNLFTASSQWIGGSGGMLLRTWTSKYSGAGNYSFVNAFQGTQQLTSYVSQDTYDGYYRLYVGVRMAVGGIVNTNDALDIRDSATSNVNGFRSRTFSEAGGSIDYRVFLGSF
jgi:hypothetical protein